jgi:hypothetical protein
MIQILYYVMATVSALASLVLIGVGFGSFNRGKFSFRAYWRDDGTKRVKSGAQWIGEGIIGLVCSLALALITKVWLS